MDSINIIKENMYFVTNSDIKIIQGKKRDIIHSLIDGKVYYFEGENRVVLRQLLEGMAWENVDGSRLDKNELMSFLENNEIGRFYESRKIYNPLIRKNVIKLANQIGRIRNFSLERISIRINSICNLKCKFCEVDGIMSAPCLCTKDNVRGENPFIFDAINQAKKMNVKMIEIMGGEPLLNRKLLYSAVDKIFTYKMNSVIHTNGIELNEDDAILFSKKNAIVVVHLFTYDKTKERQVVGINNYVEKAIQSISLLKKYNVLFFTEYIIGAYNCSDAMKQIQEQFKVSVQYKYLYPTNLYSAVNMQKPNLKIGNLQVDFQNYEMYESYNYCFRKGVFVEKNGDIYPCIGLSKSKFYLGNIEEGIYKVFRGKDFKYYWEYNNFCDEMCNQCGERLMCVNCKAYSFLNGDRIECLDEV